MSYSLLAHLYPRIKGSQEDVATYSLAYILEQSSLLNEVFTRLIGNKLGIEVNNGLTYRCQDADSKYGRPDIAAYSEGRLKILCEAKFYAGLTENQPVSYIKRLSRYEDSGLIFICPKERIISLWAKLKNTASEAGFEEKIISEYMVFYDNVRLSIISWSEILSELIVNATEREPERLGDLKQLEGLCEKIDNESFIPFRPEEFGAQTARDIDRYYMVVDEVYKLLTTHKELNPRTKGLIRASNKQGYSRYLRLNGYGVGVCFLRDRWKSQTSKETPFWFTIWEDKDQSLDRLSRYYASLESATVDNSYGENYIALIPKPYVTLEEVAEDLTNQIITIIQGIENFPIYKSVQHDIQEEI